MSVLSTMEEKSASNKKLADGMNLKRKVSKKQGSNDDKKTTTTGKNKRKKMKHEQQKNEDDKSLHKIKKEHKIKKNEKKSKNRRHRSKKQHGESSTDSNGNISQHKHVSFDTVRVYEFEYILGDSVTRKGPPISLSSKAIMSKEYTVDVFESLRPKEDVDDYLTPEIRTKILMDRGYTETQIKEASYQTAVIRMYRKESIMNMKWDDWAERKEKIGRKMKKLSHPTVLFLIPATKLRL